MRYSLAWAALCLFAFPCFAGTTQASFSGDKVQGGLLFGQTAPENQVFYQGKQLILSADGRFILGFGRDYKGVAEIKITAPDSQTKAYQFDVKPREYQIERVDGLRPSKVTPDPKLRERIKRETEMVKKARAMREERVDFLHRFRWPSCGRLSGFYGSQRILNGHPRRPHFGLDIAAPHGSVVRAPAPGIVTLGEADLFYSGGTVILDHGHGLSSSFLHLSKVSVTPGQRISAGDELGRVGATGRATGPHLDWRINWHAQRLDPLLLFDLAPGEHHTNCKSSR